MLLLKLPDIRARFHFHAVCLLSLLLFATASLAQQEKYAGGIIVSDINVSKGSNNSRELYEVVLATQELLNTLGRFQRVDPILISTLNNQLTAIKYMTPEETAAISKVELPFGDLRQQIEELNTLLNEQATDIDISDLGLKLSETASTNEFGLKIFPECQNKVRYNIAPALAFAIGPCGLENQGLSGTDRLSDAGFPLVCPFSTSAGVVVVSRITLAVLRTAAEFFEKLCYQSVFGNNTSTACIVTEVVYLALKRVVGYLAGCNAKRGDAETFISYARTADLFVSNKNNFSAQKLEMTNTLDQVGQAESDLNMDVSVARGKIEDAGDVSKILADLVALETRAIQNSQELDRVLVEQRAIMQELGIEHLYQDPNTIQSSSNLFDSDSGTNGKVDSDTTRKSKLSDVKPKGESR